MGRLPLLLVACCLNAIAQELPNFSGTWQLNLDESDFAGHTPPQGRTDAIAQSGDELSVTVKEIDGARERVGHLVYQLDGKPSANTVEGNAVTSTAKWDVTDLTIHSVTHTPQGDTTMDDRWVMSLDKRKLTIRRHHGGHGAEQDQALVEYRDGNP